MANKRLYQFLFSPNPMLTEADASVLIGSTGAVTSASGNLIQSVTRTGVGTYRITLKQPFNAFYDMSASLTETVTGGALAVDAVSAALSIGTTYQITTVGDATAAQWLALGVPSGTTIAVGVPFTALATGNGAAGTARVKAVAPSTIATVELAGNANLTVNNNTTPHILIQCLAPSFTAGAYTPTGTVSQPTLTMNSYTPAGTVSTGIVPVAAGTAGDAVTNNAGTLNSTGGEDLTVNAQTFTGNAATLTGTVSQPTFTGSAASLTGTMTMVPTDPASGSILNLHMLLRNSSVTM